VPRADLEVDVDMENVEAGAYLWGALVTDRAGTGLAEPGYRAFIDWDPDAQTAAVRAFTAFWGWLTDLLASCETAGVSFAAYCWYRSAENGHLDTGGQATGRSEQVEEFMGSPVWIDLHEVFSGQFVTGHSGSLKTVAPLTGFAWRDEDPGGAQSMQWWERATEPDTPGDEQEAIRRRLLEYNEDDVRATLHIREWLTRNADRLTAPPAR
jgi:predicted RecB family nuclease